MFRWIGLSITHSHASPPGLDPIWRFPGAAQHPHPYPPPLAGEGWEGECANIQPGIVPDSELGKVPEQRRTAEPVVGPRKSADPMATLALHRVRDTDSI